MVILLHVVNFNTFILLLNFILLVDEHRLNILLYEEVNLIGINILSILNNSLFLTYKEQLLQLI